MKEEEDEIVFLLLIFNVIRNIKVLDIISEVSVRSSFVIKESEGKSMMILFLTHY